MRARGGRVRGRPEHLRSVSGQYVADAFVGMVHVVEAANLAALGHRNPPFAVARSSVGKSLNSTSSPRPAKPSGQRPPARITWSPQKTGHAGALAASSQRTQ